METADPQPRPALIELIEAGIPARLAPETEAMAGVTWTIREGDYWVIGGLQGSGKTDLLFAAAGLSRPLRGDYRLFGHAVGPAYSDEGLADRLRVGLVFGEGGRLFPELTVRENVALPLLYHRPIEPEEIESRVRLLLAETGLETMASHFPAGLNPAWRQRVALARTLALRPEVLLLDNPLAGLDPRHARWWIQFLDRLFAGHPLLAGRSTTLAVAVDDFRPWIKPGRKYALLTETRLDFVEDPAATALLERHAVLRELLPAEPHPI